MAFSYSFAVFGMYAGLLVQAYRLRVRYMMPKEWKVMKGLGRALVAAGLSMPLYALLLIKVTNYYALFFLKVVSYGGMLFALFALADEVSLHLSLLDRGSPVKQELEPST